MSVSDEFDDWAARGKDRGMEDRHWHTAKHVLARMPVEAGDTVLDLGSGSGYAGRALKETADAGRAYGIDASPAMAENARSYTDDGDVGFLV
ncbi:class I SAM-dependent methyltransferase, partial [Haladaptatus sp. GCM10026878]